MSRSLLLLASLAAASALAGGFAVSEHDAAVTGRAGTAIAQEGRPSAVHYNPAGLAGLRGVAATAGATALLPSATATDPATGAADQAAPALKLPPHVYAAYGREQLAVGFGFNAPYGGGLKWPDTWRGRFDLVEMQLQVLGFHAGAAYAITPQLSVGAAATLYRATVFLTKHADFVDSEGIASLGGGGFGVGASFGASYTFSDRFRLGLTGKLPASIALAGRAHFDAIPASFSTALPDQAIQSHLTLPGKVGLGAELALAPVRLFADAEATFWSSFQSFDVDFAEDATPDVSQPRNWRTAGTFRLGAELPAGWLGTDGVLRAGAVFDMAASPTDTLSPSLPDSNRVAGSLGLGRAFGPVRADLAYSFVAFLPTASSGEAFPAQYAARAHLFALSLGYRQN